MPHEHLAARSPGRDQAEHEGGRTAEEDDDGEQEAEDAVAARVVAERGEHEGLHQDLQDAHGGDHERDDESRASQRIA